MHQLTVRRTIYLLPILALCAARPVVANPIDPESLGAAPSVAEIAEKGYKLAWSDEFNGTAVDTQKWDFRTDSKRSSTQKAENATVGDGLLHLGLKKNPEGQNKPYAGAGLISKPAFMHGYYEAKFKIPAASGWHTSFWMQKHDGSGGTSPRATCQELDACENDSNNRKGYNVNVHKWPAPHTTYGTKYITAPGLNLAEDFHTLGCEFTPESVKYYLDGKLVQSVDATKFEHGEQNIWLTSIANDKGVDPGMLPSEAVYDYVRFYELPAAK